MIRLIIAVVVGAVIALGGTVLVTNVLSTQANGAPGARQLVAVQVREPVKPGEPADPDPPPRPARRAGPGQNRHL